MSLIDKNGYAKLSDITGKKVVEVLGLATDPYDSGALKFQVCRIILEDGTKLDVAGEHDWPYIEEADAVPEARLKEVQEAYKKAFGF